MEHACQLIVRAQDLESQGRYSCAAKVAGEAATRLLIAQKLLAQAERLNALRAERMPQGVARC
jgi:hypothetical protein